jgi:hypothetical protein
MSCSIKVKLSADPMFAQINAVNKFCEPLMSKLHAAILARIPYSLPNVDPTDKLSGDRKEIEARKLKESLPQGG